MPGFILVVSHKSFFVAFWLSHVGLSFRFFLFHDRSFTMSWMGDFTPGSESQKDAPPPEREIENTDKVEGTFGKPVAAKKANQPFLKYVV